MDTLSDIETAVEPGGAAVEPCMDPPPAIGSDERRMHVRAYNFWASLLHGRIFPSIDDLEPAKIGDFGPHAVLLDFSADRSNPAIPWLGRALANEGLHVDPVATLADVPDGSLLARLSDHYTDVVANRAPIGFEAEFENAAGNHSLYRGILMPFSSDGSAIDFIYGVINWKEVANAALVAGIAAEVARTTPAARPAAAEPAWADGPSRQARQAGDPGAARPDPDDPLFRAATEGADLARSTGTRARAALFRALGLAYDLLLANMTADGGVTERDRRTATLIRRLFMTEETVRQRRDYAAVLAYGLRTGVPPGGLRMVLDQHPGGLNGLARAERQARRSRIDTDIATDLP